MESQTIAASVTVDSTSTPSEIQNNIAPSGKEGKGRTYAFVCSQSFSHMHPTFELARELIAAGNIVKYFSAIKYKSIIEKNGAQFIDYESDKCNMMGAKPPPDGSQKNKNILMQILDSIEKEAWPVLQRELPKVDVIVYDAFSVWGKHYAEQNNIPCFCSNTMILTSNEDYINGLNLDQQNEKQMEFVSCCTGSKANGVILYTFPGFTVSPIPEEIKVKYILFGSRFCRTYKPSMVQFDPQSLIYISIGTVWKDTKDIMKTFATYFSSTEHEVIITTGGIEGLYEKLKELELGKNIHVEKFVDQLEILGRASLFINHAGMNSVYEGLSLGVPMVMVPQIKEQYMNACKVRDSGAGYLLPLEKLSEEEVRIAMMDVEANWQKYKQGALSIREKMLEADDGKTVVKKMNDILEHL